jgi:tetratricopeptide (TPR) repeat protein
MRRPPRGSPRENTQTTPVEPGPGVLRHAANSSILDAAGVFRRDSNRARDAAERSLEKVDEAADRPAWLAQTSSVPPPLSVGLSHSVHRSRQAEAYFARGNRLLEARKYREARDQFVETTALSPGEGLYNGLGWSRFRLGRYHLAEEAFRSALERNPDYVDALNGLGSALFARAQYEAALRPLEKALQESQRLVRAESPELTTLRGKMAWSLYYVERYREALAMFIRASLAVPDAYPYQVGMGWC